MEVLPKVVWQGSLPKVVKSGIVGNITVVNCGSGWKKGEYSVECLLLASEWRVNSEGWNRAVRKRTTKKPKNYTKK